VAGDAHDQRQEVDATRRTHLANERTYLAWLRTGLAIVAVGFGIGKLVPVATGSAHVLGVLGAAFALFGLAISAYGLLRFRRVSAALRGGQFSPLGENAALVFTVAAAVLAIAAVVVIFTT
jgi:putative membrane protein